MKTKPCLRCALCLVRYVSIALLSICLPLPARAGGPLAICQSGQPFLWPNGGAGIGFNPDQGSLGPLNNAEAVAEVEAAFDAWAAVPTAKVSFANAGPLPVDVDINNFADFLFASAPDGLNAIVFDDTGEIFDLLFGPESGILGFAGPEWIRFDTCEIVEGFAFLNGPAFSDAVAARDVMVHEFGHYVGLAHSVVNGQIFLGDSSGPSPDNTFGLPDIEDIETMYPFYFGPGSGMASLAKDDIATVSALYPEAGFESSTVTIAGTIRRASSVPLTGVNVIARNVADPFKDAVSAISGDYSVVSPPGDPLTGTYHIPGLTPGAQYAVFIDEIVAGGFSTPPVLPLPGREEFYNGTRESNNLTTSDPVLDMTPVSAGAGSEVTGIDIIFNQPRPGEPLPLADDGSFELPLPFGFHLAGTRYDSVFVNANGNLTFGAPDSSFQGSAASFLAGPPRIAPFWDDLNPTQGGIVTYAQTPNSFTVIFSKVPEFFNVGEVSFDVTLNKGSDNIDIRYGKMTSIDGLSGVTGGGATTSGSEAQTDLSKLQPQRINLQNQPAMYELFGSSNPNDLSNGTLRYDGTTTYNDDWAGPNNTIVKARAIQLPFNSEDLTHYTEIEPTGADVDYYRFRLKAGDVFVARVTSGQLDSLLGLFKITGTGNKQNGTLVAYDDDSGPGTLSTLLYQVPVTGDYALAATTYPDFDFKGAGLSGGRYVLDVFVATPDPKNPVFNGGFEFGFLGWTAQEIGSPFIPWMNEGAGSGSGFGMAPTQPQEGLLEAWNGFDGDGPMLFTLYQDVTLRSGATSATLSWKNRLQWNFLVGTQTQPRTYEVQLRDPNTDAVLQTLFLFDTGIADGLGDSGWTSHSVDVSAYLGTTVRLWFQESIPEAFTGPGQFELDAVSLNIQ
jgi:hypothetical protein